MSVFLKLFSVLLIAFPINCWSAIEINLSRSQLSMLALKLETAPSDQQIEFSRIALSQMYMAYGNELTHSLSERPEKLKSKVKLNRWRKATNHYLQEIEYALNHILSGNDYSFFVNQQGRIVFFAASQTIMVSGPSNKSDSKMESEIISQFCGLFDCQVYLSKDEEKYFEHLEPTMNGYWLMSKRHRADFYINKGIIFRFSNLDNKKAKENWSLHLTQDLLSLLETLKLVQKKGYSIDWPSIAITGNSDQGNTIKFTINKDKDFINATLPTLGKTTEIFQQVKSWLRQIQLNNIDVETAIIVLSEQYYAEV